mgnify:CR=1 FL=1
MRSVNDRVTSLNDWRDLSSEQQVCINLELWNDHKIREIGEQVFQHIRRKISPQLVSVLLVLAYNLQDDCNHECFDSVPNDLQSTTFMTEWDQISDQFVIGFILSVKTSMREIHEDILGSRDKVFSYLSVNFEDWKEPRMFMIAMETCVDRLDIAMYNVILCDNDAPTDPISDPITDFQVLPIPTRALSFGTSAQL